MELQIEKVKDKMIMCRFAPEVFAQIEKLAAKNKTSNGKIIRALVDKALVAP
mgnify:FL=1